MNEEERNAAFQQDVVVQLSELRADVQRLNAQVLASGFKGDRAFHARLRKTIAQGAMSGVFWGGGALLIIYFLLDLARPSLTLFFRR